MARGERPEDIEADRKPLWQRLGWLVLIWGASVAVLGSVAWLLRLWIAP